MDIDAMIERVNNAYLLIGNVAAMGDELDRLALARQELRNLRTELMGAKKAEAKVGE